MKVFLSHSSYDIDVTRRLAAELRRSGVDVWLDEWEILVGDSICQKVEQGLTEADLLVVILTKRSVASGWVLREWQARFAKEVRIGKVQVLPVLAEELDDTWELPPLLADKRYANVACDFNAGLADIKRAIDASSSAPQGPKPTSDGIEAYVVHGVVSRGHYSLVRKCHVIESSELCIVKQTDADVVSVNALRALQRTSCLNIAAPRRIWSSQGFVYEELPYVGGMRLSDAVVPGIGGLSADVLESFDRQMMSILGEVHALGLVHRDVHPDNIYLVTQSVQVGGPVERKGERLEDPDERHVHQHEDDFFGDGNPFLLRWVLVDNTFTVEVSDATHRAPVTHGAYTPEDQARRTPTAASDMYALGATMYYAVTGREVPPFSRRVRDPGALGELPSAEHSSFDFSDYLGRLLSIAPERRPRSALKLLLGTKVGGYSGVLRLSTQTFLLIGHGYTSIVGADEALRTLLGMRHPANPDRDGPRWLAGEASWRYWVKTLSELVY